MSRTLAHLTEESAHRSPRRRSIVVMLLAAFLAVSLVPISVLAFLSWRESRFSEATRSLQ